MRKSIVAIVISSLFLLLAGCGGGGGSSTVAVATSPFSVTGKITLNGAGLGQVAIAAAGAGTEYSDGSGNYTFSHLANGSYTITPSRSGYTFSPASQTVAINNNGAVVNFTASPIPSYAVSGTVSSANGAGLAGAAVSVASAATGAAVSSQLTDGAGHFAIAGLNNGGYVVTVSHPDGYSFTPASQSVTVSNGNVSANFAASVATHTVSGTVTTGSGTGLANVVLVLSLPSTGASYSTQTSGSGSFSLAGIPDGYYSMTPTLVGYAFVPNPLLIHVSGADSTGNSISAAPAGSGSGSITISF
jgi:hypothetical protein